jgi:hypothetical protein
MTAMLDSAHQTIRIQDKSETFDGLVDRLYVELVTTGSPDIGTTTDLFCALALY